MGQTTTPPTRMNSISIAHAGNEKYYLKLGKEDYYTAAFDPSGVFIGKGAKRLGIEGKRIEQNDERLKNLFRGLSPDGERLLRQGAYQIRNYKSWQFKDTDTGKVSTFKSEKSIPPHLKEKVKEITQERRSVVAYDNVFSAPKDFSILWSLAPDNLTRQRLHNIHEYAVSRAIKYLEENACYVRSGKAGAKCEKAEAIFAVFQHTTSRELDPQLHSHVVMLNVGFNSCGKSLALDGRKILEHRYTSGMVYQNTLRRSLELNFQVNTFDKPFSDGKGVSFGVVGISPQLREKFSERSQQIEKMVSPNMSPKEVRTQVLASRKEKNLTIETKDLIAAWQKRGRDLGFLWENVVAQKNQDRSQSTEKIDEKIATHLQQHPNTQKNLSHVGAISEPQITTAALSASRGKVTTDDALKLARDFKERFMRLSSPSQEEARKCETRNFYRLSGEGRKLINFESVKISLYGTAKNLINYYTEWLSDQRKKVLISSKSNPKFSAKSIKIYKIKMSCLYATGKITRKQYLRFTKPENMPISKFKINVYEALGLMSKRQAYRLMNEHHSSNFWKNGDPFVRNLSPIAPIDALVAYTYKVTKETASKEHTEKRNKADEKQKSYEREV
jgi:conjugative relaxase-like TrwC/TraI family protein